MLKNPVIIVEDDLDDQEILQDIFESLGVPYELKIFDRCPDVLQYLRSTTEQPLIILCDVNLPAMNGIELREEILKDDYLRQKSIPFVFLTTSGNPLYIREAYKMQVQGYFLKQHSFEEMKTMIRLIMDYWVVCRHPNR